ncbi:alpha/beta fold hydrolase [Actinoplanes sp. G11-F43]|uniref:alpha/beta fold hydrolase n=1 Tax=Actinoplanes sp. G11-F43 TaxID=3424130 RepID=UPI003D32B20E
MNMHVVHDGDRQAPPMLLVHGSGAAGSSWNPVVPALAAHRHVIRVDLPGCGQSPPAGSYDVPAQAARVAALLDHLGVGPVTAAGHSSGGYLVTALAERRPDLVASLALISTGPSVEAMLPEPMLLRMLMAPPIGPLLWSARTDTMIRAGIRSTAVQPVDIGDDWIGDLRAVRYRDFRAVLREYTAYLAARSVPDRLTPLGIPLLAIFGDADPRWNPDHAFHYESVPGAHLEMLAGIGHLPMAEAPSRIVDLLLTVRR